MSGKIVVMKERKVGPSDFQREVNRLRAEGRLPSLEDVLAAVAEARREFRPKILAARNRKRRP